MITSQVSHYVGKMHNLQTIEIPKKSKNSVNTKMLKTLNSPLRY